MHSPVVPPIFPRLPRPGRRVSKHEHAFSLLSVRSLPQVRSTCRSLSSSLLQPPFSSVAVSNLHRPCFSSSAFRPLSCSRVTTQATEEALDWSIDGFDRPTRQERRRPISADPVPPPGQRPKPRACCHDRRPHAAASPHTRTTPPSHPPPPKVPPAERQASRSTSTPSQNQTSCQEGRRSLAATASAFVLPLGLWARSDTANLAPSSNRCSPYGSAGSPPPKFLDHCPFFSWSNIEWVCDPALRRHRKTRRRFCPRYRPSTNRKLLNFGSPCPHPRC